MISYELLLQLKCKFGISDTPAEIKQGNQGTVSFIS